MLKCFRAVLSLSSLLALVSCGTDLTLESTGEPAGVSARILYVSCLSLPPTGDCGPAPSTVVEVGPATTIDVTFSEPVDPRTIGGVWEIFALPGMERIEGRSQLVDNDRRLVFTPAPGSLDGEMTVRIGLTPDVQPRDGGGDGIPVFLELRGRQWGGVDLPMDIVTAREPPSPVRDLQGEALSATSALFTWNPAEDEVSPAEKLTYRLYQTAVGADLIFGENRPTTGPGELEIFVSRLRPSTLYIAAMSALDEAGNESELSNVVFLETRGTQVVDTTAPDFAGVTAVEPPPAESPESASSLLVRWEPGVDDFDRADRLRVQVRLAFQPGGQDRDTPCDESPLCQTSVTGATELVLRGLAPDTTYYVIAQALDSSGNFSPAAVERSGTTRLSFARNILPILSERDPALGGGCNRAGCHRMPFPAGGLDLVSHEALLAGGRRTRTDPVLFPIVVPFEEVADDMESYLIRRIEARTRADQPRMPLGSPEPLAAEFLERLKRWIHQGALDN